MIHQAAEDRFAFHFGDYYGRRAHVRARYSYKWASERVKNVLGIAFSVPAKDEVGDAPKESIMRSGESPEKNLIRQWVENDPGE